MRETPPGLSGSGEPSKHLDDTYPVTLYSSTNPDGHASGYTVASRSSEEKEPKGTDDSEIEQHQCLRRLIKLLLSKSTEDKRLAIKLSHEDSPKPGSLCNIHNAAPKTAASVVTQKFSFQSDDATPTQPDPTVAVDTRWNNDQSRWQAIATPGNNATRGQQLQACAIALAQAHIAQVLGSGGKDSPRSPSVSFTVYLGEYDKHAKLIHDAIDDYFTAVACIVASIEGFYRGFHATVNFNPSSCEPIKKPYPNNIGSTLSDSSLFKKEQNDSSVDSTENTDTNTFTGKNK